MQTPYHDVVSSIPFACANAICSAPASTSSEFKSLLSPSSLGSEVRLGREDASIGGFLAAACIWQVSENMQ